MNMGDVIFALGMPIILGMGCKGFYWFLGFGQKKRHRNWSSEQILRRDKRYAEYFKE